MVFTCHIAILDAVGSALAKDRTEMVNEIIGDWASKKLHEATVIMRVARANPSLTDTQRKGDGK